MYVLRPLCNKNGRNRSYRFVFSKKSCNHVSFVRAKFCTLNNFYTSFNCSVLFLAATRLNFSYLKECGYLNSNKVAAQACGGALGGSYKEYKKYVMYVKIKKKS